MKKVVLMSLGIFAWLFSCLALADEATPAPITMLQNTSDQVIAALKQNKASLKNDPGVVYQIVDKILVPHVDLNGMSRSVLGRDVWNNATAAQKQQFNQQFKDLLIHTYASAFANYSNQTVQFMPIRGGLGNQTRIQVSSQILQQGGPAIPVSYRLVKEGNDWKVYDFSVEGISMLESFRSQFASELSQGNLDELINKLTVHNNQKPNA